MIRSSHLLTLLVGGLVLAGMMLSNPDYNSTIRPFVRDVVPGDAGQTRLMAGRFDRWRTADRLIFTRYGKQVSRDTQGVFLIVEPFLAGTTVSTMVRASWVGPSGRHYAESGRVSGLPRQTEDLWLQPGLDSRALAIFELPPDEVAGGALLVSLRTDPPLDGTLLLKAPAPAPEHQGVTRLGP